MPARRTRTIRRRARPVPPTAGGRRLPRLTPSRRRRPRRPPAPPRPHPRPRVQPPPRVRRRPPAPRPRPRQRPRPPRRPPRPRRSRQDRDGERWHVAAGPQACHDALLADAVSGRPRGACAESMSASRRARVGCLAFALAAAVVSANCAGDDDGSQMRSTAARAPANAKTTGTTAQESTTAAPGGLPSGVRLREPDGSYPTGLPNDPTFFPIGVWLETVIDASQVAMDRSVGLNLYVALAHDEVADLDAIEAGGMHLLLQADEWADDPRADSPAVDGWLVYDEADLMYRPGWDEWTGTPGWNTCTPTQDEGGRCGYTVMQHYNDKVPRGALRYANYGLDVLHWETDDEADVFINHGFQDVVSADDYAFTHPDASPSDRRGAFYGWIVKRIRDLDGRDGVRQPVWSFVEVGHPFEDDSAPTITAPQMRSAVWHSIIAGARGGGCVNHRCGGPRKPCRGLAGWCVGETGR